MRITKTLIARSTPAKKRYFLWDRDPPGFGLAVHPTGAQSYVFQFRTPQGRTRRMTIASVNALTPDQARARARELSESVRKGGDPLEDKAAARNELTVAELLAAYLESEAFREKARSTQETDRGRIENHLKPLLGRKFARRLTAEDVKRARRAIIAGKTARDEKTGWRARSIVRGGEGAARQSVRILAAAYSWAIEEGLTHSNPVRGVKTGGDGSRNIIMRDSEDYRRLFETLAKFESEKRVRSDVADIIRLIALTGARRDEITGLEWREIDLEKGLVSIPAGRHKTGRRTNSARIIGLPSPAKDILARQPRGADASLVFPPARADASGRSYPSSRKGAPPRVNVTRPWRTIRREAKLSEGIGLHGLRHSLATHMALQGAQAAEIMTALGHRKLATAQRYIHYAEDARAALAERAATMMTRAMKDEKQ